MKIIAHRGLLNGPNKGIENKPEHILEVLSRTDGVECEIDVWMVYNRWFLGHDEPQYEVDTSFLGKQGLWIHCKNLDALHWFTESPIHYEYFWHENDNYTLTSGNLIWAYPGKHLSKNSIAVLPEISDDYWEYVKSCKITGVCTDYVEKFISETSTMPIGST